MDRIWLKTDGDKLKALRESSGIDPVELARAVTLTPAHIRQLEDGGDSMFYSQAIKLQVGRRLLRRLGSDLDAIETEEPASAAMALDMPAEKGMEPAVAQATVAEPPQPAATPWPAEASIADHADRAGHRLSDWLKPLMQWFPAAAATAAVAMVGGVLFQVLKPAASPEVVSVNMPAPARKAEPAPTPMMTAQAAEQVAAPTPSGPQAPSTPEASAVTKAAAPTSPDTAVQPSAAAAAHTSALPNCTRLPNETVALQPPSSTKPANYVHLVATQETTLCVVDGTSRVTTLHLKPGDARSIYGSAPWRLHSPALAQLEVYFQGHRMNGAIGSANHVVFTEHSNSVIN